MPAIHLPRRKISGLVAVAALAAALLAPGGSRAAVSEPSTFVAAGTVVAKQTGSAPDLDRGVVVCDPAAGRGIGGVCIPFAGGRNAIGVLDALASGEVAFQACIDNSGDGACTVDNRTTINPCTDDIFYSHDDQGRFFNPLGPLPAGFWQGCAGQENFHGFPGYVVFICDGVHLNQGEAHSHSATSGTVELVAGGTGYGTFCASEPGADEDRGLEPPAKHYVVV